MAEQAGRGSTGNVIAAVCSFFIPGLGQLVQGRVLAAVIHFLLGVAVWVITFGVFGWIANVISTIDAAVWKPKA